MSLRDIIQQVGMIQRDLEQQKRILDDFQRSNRKNIQLVTSELRGSQKSYDQVLNSRLQQVEQSLTRSSNALDQASTALKRVQNI